MYKQISANVRLTWGLIFVFLILIIGIGWIFSWAYDAPIILVVAAVVAIVQALSSYFYGDKIALGASGAKLASREQFTNLFRSVENISIASGLPQPKIYVISDPTPNAFATGRDPKNSSLAVTTGLLEKLTKTEVEGVISHEMAHVGNRDILVMTIVVVLVGVVALASDWVLRMSFWRSNDRRDGGYAALIAIALAILAPISAMLVQLAISRKREYLADATGALITRYPEGLASALEKISKDTSRTNLRNRAVAHLFISDPYRKDKEKAPTGRESWFSVAFSTHPPIAERVRKLRGMIGG